MTYSRKPRTKAEPMTAPALYEYALGALGRRMRTVAQLKRLMRVKVEEGEAGEAKVDAVVTKLKAMHYLDDTAFATEFTRLRKENEKFGKRRVQQELMLRGIHPELVNKTLDTAYEDVNEENLARLHLERKGIRKPENEKETARVMRRLVRAGFSLGVIYRILKNWQVDEDSLASIETLEMEDEAGPEE